MVYASELNILAYTAYGQTEGCSRAMVDKLVLNVFKRNLRGLLGAKVREQYPPDIDAAIVLARNLEISGVTETTPIPASTVVAEVSAVQQQQSRQVPQARFNPHMGKKCHACGKLNHISRDCWSKNKNNSGGNNNNNNGANSRAQGWNNNRQNNGRPQNGTRDFAPEPVEMDM